MTTNPSTPQSLSLKLGMASRQHAFSLPDSHVWCGSVAELPQGGWFMAYSHWPLAYGHYAWASHSTVGLAVADDMMGPYRDYSPRICSSFPVTPIQHNPVVLRKGDRFFLYFSGNTGPWAGDNPPETIGIGMHLTDWWKHRNNQRVHMAHTTDPLGEWELFQQPLLEPDPEYVLTATPFVFQRLDGRIQAVIKTVRDNRTVKGGCVEHHTYLADHPAGPFEKIATELLPGMQTDFPLDDHCEFCFDGCYYAIVKDHGEGLTPTVPALLLLQSEDGHHWRLADDSVVTPFQLRWDDGAVTRYERLEMPRVLFKGGRPFALQLSAWEGADSQSFNLRVPLEIGI